MENLQIKKTTEKDMWQLQQICIQTFKETFSDMNSEENMKKYLTESFSDEQLLTELRDKNAAYYFALLNEKVAGYLKVNFGHSQNELKDENALEIERIYVLKSFQGKRVGQLLFEKALKIAAQKEVDFVWLGVWEHNTKALRFYRKNGFVVFDEHVFMLGNDKQTDLMMKRQIKNQ
ncbi:MAG: GNAT family N-acetyltransferase [Bacteroidota bacterium]